ncbi:hypothetical protein NL676_000741 [Syzygium grande]|nr:hypothetical protein NL676_000741 [Syzygium grande]
MTGTPSRSMTRSGRCPAISSFRFTLPGPPNSAHLIGFPPDFLSRYYCRVPSPQSRFKLVMEKRSGAGEFTCRSGPISRGVLGLTFEDDAQLFPSLVKLGIKFSKQCNC